MVAVGARYLAIVSLFLALATNIYGQNYKKLRLSWPKNQPDAQEVLLGEQVQESALSASDESAISQLITKTTGNNKKQLTESTTKLKRVSLKRARGDILTTEGSASKTPVISKVVKSK
jgi:hypothetical protein